MKTKTKPSRRLGSIAAALFIALTACAGQLLAKTCDQPVVSFQAGQLSVSSQGCSLQQVLNAISRQTGIQVEMPPAASSVPVFAVLGPGHSAHVISELLDGSPFNCALTAKADGSGSLMRVVLTERVAFVPDQAPASAANPSAPAGGASGSGAQMAARASLVATANVDDQSDRPRARAQIDEDTLKKLPPLPSGIPTAMWQLYPSLVQSIIENGGVLPSGPTPSNSAISSNSANPAQPSGPLPFDPATAPKGAIGLPPMPPDVAAIGKLYPWNLMQLIQMPVQHPPSDIFQIYQPTVCCVH